MIYYTLTRQDPVIGDYGWVRNEHTSVGISFIGEGAFLQWMRENVEYDDWFLYYVTTWEGDGGEWDDILEQQSLEEFLYQEDGYEFNLV